MARTIEQIFGEMVAQKEETTALNGLTSASRVAVWRLIFYICAVAISIVETLYDVHKEQVEIESLRAVAGSLPWYASETLIYQHGDTLFYNRENGQLNYAQDLPDLQIIDLSASSDDATGEVFVKAAKIVSGQAAPLSTDELNGLIGYWNQKKFAGTLLSVTSDPADKLRIGYRIIYDATILTADGKLIIDDTIKPVEVAINEYLIAFGLDNFNGTFQLMKMTDAVQAASGVINAICYIAEAVKDDDTGLVDILAEQDNLYETVAGYLIINTTYPLVNTIIYEALA